MAALRLLTVVSAALIVLPRDNVGVSATVTTKYKVALGMLADCWCRLEFEMLPVVPVRNIQPPAAVSWKHYTLLFQKMPFKHIVVRFKALWFFWFLPLDAGNDAVCLPDINKARQ